MVLKASGSRAYAGLALTLQGAVAPRVLPKVGQSSSPSLPETLPPFCVHHRLHRCLASDRSVPDRVCSLSRACHGSSCCADRKQSHGRGTSGLGALGHGGSRSGQAGGSCRGLPRACVPAEPVCQPQRAGEAVQGPRHQPCARCSPVLAGALC